jgi:hypothetical protein
MCFNSTSCLFAFLLRSISTALAGFFICGWLGNLSYDSVSAMHPKNPTAQDRLNPPLSYIRLWLRDMYSFLLSLDSLRFCVCMMTARSCARRTETHRLGERKR